MTQAQDILDFYERQKTLTWQEHMAQDSQANKDLYRLYFDLQLDEGRKLAETAFDLFETDPNLAEDILSALACFVDGALNDIHGRLIERRGDYFPYLFRSAAPAVAIPLIDELNIFDRWSTTSHSINYVLLVLAWIGGERVEQEFRAWRETPPEWERRRLIQTSSINYAREAGWELTPGDTRRDLFFQMSYRLVETPDAAHPAAVRVMRTLGDTCPICSHHLHAMFDLDLTLPELTFLRIGGEHLTIMTCTTCTLRSTVFTDVDWHGGAAWDKTHNPQRDTTDDAPIYFPDQRLAIGPARRSAYEALFDHGFFSPSQIGGCPIWVQHSAYPDCPSCGHLMRYIGQTNIGDLTGPLPKGTYYPTEGSFYAFLCTDCHKAATRFQFS